MTVTYAQQLHVLHQAINSPASSSLGGTLYRNNIQRRKEQALSTSFPVTGDAFPSKTFMALCFAYAKNYPSVQWDINVYGSQFPDFIAAQVNSQQATVFPWSWYSGIAQIEQSIRLAYYANSSSEPLTVHLNMQSSPVSAKGIVSLFIKLHRYLKCIDNIVGITGFAGVVDSAHNLIFTVTRNKGDVVLLIENSDPYGSDR